MACRLSRYDERERSEQNDGYEEKGEEPSLLKPAFSKSREKNVMQALGNVEIRTAAAPLA